VKVRVTGVADRVRDLVSAGVALLVRLHIGRQPRKRRLGPVVVGDVPERLLVTVVVAVTVGELLVVRLKRRQSDRVVLGRVDDVVRDVPDLPLVELARERRHSRATGRDLAYNRAVARPERSEEHTSELQSPYDLVC